MPINLHIVCDPSSFEPSKDWERVEDFKPYDVNDQVEAYTERDRGPKYRAITKYEQSSRNLLFQTTLFSHLVAAQTVMIYTSWGGNPVHKGHMGMIAKAINHFIAKGVHIEKVCVSLSYESYIRGKVEGANFKIKKENVRKPTEEKSLLKVLLSRSDRIKYLNAAIQEMREENQYYSRIILEGDAAFQDYSSSRIQNGEYDLLPKSFAENFQILHEQAQNS